MAKKPPPKAMFTLKHDFYDSLDNVLQQALNLMQAVDTAIQLGAVTGPAAEVLQKQSAAMRAALSSDD
jgi:hypothetical protein